MCQKTRTRQTGMPLTCSTSSFTSQLRCSRHLQEVLPPPPPFVLPHPVPDPSVFCFPIITSFSLGCDYVRTGLSSPLDQRCPKSRGPLSLKAQKALCLSDYPAPRPSQGEWHLSTAQLESWAWALLGSSSQQHPLPPCWAAQPALSGMRQAGDSA